MKKKLIAVAVAGALGAPALALAQASTVQIYGTFYLEYNYWDQGANKVNTDGLITHDSNIGFKGEEALGGGLSAWFQCESTADVTGNGNNSAGVSGSWCGRNSAIGFKGAFGNVYFGLWDTPQKNAQDAMRIFGRTGLVGQGEPMWNGSASPGINGTVSPASFNRRQGNLISYKTPEFSGFSAGFAFSAANEATAATSASVIKKPRLWSLGLDYKNGPLWLQAGYEKHSDYNPAAQATYTGGSDVGWDLGVSYTFMGNLRVAGGYVSQSYDTAPGQTLDHKGYTLGADWNFSGPHRIRGAWTHSPDNSGNSRVAVNTYQAPCLASGVCRSDTGVDLYSIQYAYVFSKRTEVNFTYATANNDQNARYAIQSGPSRPLAGENQSGFGVGFKHTF